MKHSLWTGVLFLAAATSAAAQDLSPFRYPAELLKPFESTVAAPANGPTFGVRAGYIKPRDADTGTWFGGIQIRIPVMPSLAIEGSIEFHKNEFVGGDATVVQYPLQVTALFFFAPGAPINPYVLGGVGWYYTRIHFSGSLSLVDDETDSTFGGHIGFGADFKVGIRTTLSADVRYIFLSPDSSAIQDEKFDSLQFTLALNFAL